MSLFTAQSEQGQLLDYSRIWWIPSGPVSLPPSILRVFKLRRSQPCKKMARDKVKTDCKNGSQHPRCTPNAHLTFEYSLKAIFTQLFTAKSKHTQKGTSRAFFFLYIYKTQECNASSVSVNTESPFYIVLCFRQSCTVTALSSKMHLVVLSHCRVRTTWRVTGPPGLASNQERSVDLSPPIKGFVTEVCICGASSYIRLVQPVFESTKKAATGSAGKAAAAVPDPASETTPSCCTIK